MIGVERSTPRYMVMEELDKDKIKGKAEMRAWKYERKLEESKRKTCESVFEENK